MRKTLAVVVTTLTVGAFAGQALACGAMRTADRGTEVATAEQTTKPIQQTRIPTEQAR